MRIVKIKYKTPKGDLIENYFLDTLKGYKVIHIEEGYLDKSNEIIEIKEVNDDATN